MWRFLHDAWWRLATQSHPRSFPDALACSVLQTGSVAYQAAVRLRNLAYDRGWARQVRLPCRVVSVGNLTVGGTGKTACVALIAKKMTAMGRRVAVLSRGYGGVHRSYWLMSEDGRFTVNGGAANADGLADEPQLLANQLEGLPIIVGPRRDRTGEQACREFSADTVILDDGFQHRRLARDCDIVLVHARMPLGGWAVLPRGPMREPMGSLKRAHVLIVTKADEALETVAALRERLRSFNSEAALVTAVHEPSSLLDGATGERQDPKRLQGLRVGLVSSIGDPAGFEATVRRLDAAIVWHLTFPDHHRYGEGDWAHIVETAQRSRPNAVLTTEKDWVRLQRTTHNAQRTTAPIWILGIVMKILDGEEALDARLAGLHAR